MMHYLKLIRYQNLLMIALLQITLRYGFLSLQHITLALSHWQFALLVFATVLIAAGGYIINDIHDVNTDAENRPDRLIVGKLISEANAYNLYVGATVMGVVLGFYLSNAIDKPGFSSIFIAISAMLYLYATSLKQGPLIGNILIAFLLSLTVIIVGIFDLLPMLYEGNSDFVKLILGVLLDYAIFAFIINLIREMVKDVEDFDGDYKQGMRTLPIIFGVSKTSKLIFVLSLAPIVLCCNYIYVNVFDYNLMFATKYGLLLIVAPLIYFTTKIWSAKSSDDYRHLSQVLKWVLFFGILSIVVISFNIKYNA